MYKQTATIKGVTYCLGEEWVGSRLLLWWKNVLWWLLFLYAKPLLVTLASDTPRGCTITHFYTKKTAGTHSCRQGTLEVRLLFLAVLSFVHTSNSKLRQWVKTRIQEETTWHNFLRNSYRSMKPQASLQQKYWPKFCTFPTPSYTCMGFWFMPCNYWLLVNRIKKLIWLWWKIVLTVSLHP